MTWQLPNICCQVSENWLVPLQLPNLSWRGVVGLSKEKTCLKPMAGKARKSGGGAGVSVDCSLFLCRF